MSWKIRIYKFSRTIIVVRIGFKYNNKCNLIIFIVIFRTNRNNLASSSLSGPMALKAFKPFEHHSSMVQNGLTGAFKPLLHRSCNIVHTAPPTIDVALVRKAYVILVDPPTWRWIKRNVNLIKIKFFSTDIYSHRKVYLLTQKM